MSRVRFANARIRLQDGKLFDVEDLKTANAALELIDDVPKFYDGMYRKDLIPKSDVELWRLISK